MPPKVKKRKVNSSKLVVKDNKLINARYNLSVSEMRLFLSMITQISKDDGDFKEYRIQISDFTDTIGTSAKNLYDRAQQTSKRLMEKVFEIEEEDGPLQVSLISKAKYYKGKGYVDLRFDPALKPYLIQLKEKFTAYDIRNVIQLQSTHSIRIYELLKQYEKIGERRMGVQELKETLGVADQYSRYNDFKRYVLLQAQKDLNKHCDITFEFKEEKQGRRIQTIHFVILRGKAPTLPHSKAPEDKQAMLIGELKEMGISESQALELVADKDPIVIQNAIAYTQKRYGQTKGTKNEIRNLSAYLLSVIDKEGGVAGFVTKEEEKTKVEQQKQQAQKEALAERKKANQLIERLQQGFRAFRNAKAKEAIAHVTEEQWAAFTAYVEENPYLKKKYILDGHLQKQMPGIEDWLGTFLLNQDWPDNPDNFIKWVHHQHGYQLVYERIKGEGTYRVLGKQESLFK